MKKITKYLITLLILGIILLSNTSCAFEYKVTFDGEEQIVSLGKYAVAPTPEEKEGYDFIGWFTEDGSKYSSNSLVLKNIDYQSKYEIKKFDITFIVDDKQETKEYEYGSTIGDSYPVTKEGFTFSNWYEDGEIFTTDTIIKEDHYLQASFKANIYTISYTVDGEVIDKKEVEHNGLADSTVLAGYKQGYTFVGWYYNDEPFNFETAITSDYILEAYYDVRKCTVVFVNDEEITSVKVTYGMKVELPDIKLLDGVEFLGWYNDDKVFDFTTKITKDYRIEAKYNFPMYTVSFDANGDVTKQTIRVGKTCEKPKTPSIKGLAFKGWYLGEVEFDFTTPITKDITITAKFDFIYHTVTFKYDSKEVTQEVIEGYIAVKPMDPVKDNKVFDGWYLSDSLYDFKTTVLEDIELVPHFSDYKTDKIYVTYDFGYECYQTKADLRYAYYSEYYNFLTYKGYNFKSKSISNVDDFIKAMTDFYYGGRREMGKLGDAFASEYLQIIKGGTWEDQPTSKFMGYCYQNNKFVDLLYHLQEFFAYWRTDEGYSQSDSNGNDWFASNWASLVDTTKFFYFTSDDIYNEYSWFTSTRVHDMLDNIPGVGYRNLVYSSNDPITLPQDVKRSGYTFLGWYDSNNNPVTTVTSSMTVHAKWSTGPVKTLVCYPDAKTKGSTTCNYAATPSQTSNSYIYGPRIIIGFDGTNYYVQDILKGDGTKNPSSYAYRIVAYNKSCYTNPSYLIKVGQTVKISNSDDYLVFEFYDN